MERFDVIVIGGGAAGLMCAFTAGRRGRRVALLEHNARVGQKIAISGGGRCNFTNLGATPENYLSANPRFCTSALARYTPEDFLALVEKHRIAWHEKKLGQLFCDHSSRADHRNAPRANARSRKCDRALRHAGSRSVEKADHFSLGTNRGAIDCDSLVIATGGLSFPKLGATDFGYRIARTVRPRARARPRPGLVPFTFADA